MGKPARNISYLGTVAPDTGPAPELLATKLAPPPPPAGLVARPRPTALLDGALSRRVTLLSTPPGYGKTTLLSAWLASLARRPDAPPVAWLALDEQDDDPARFASYLLAALERAIPGCTGHAQAALRSIQAPPPETLVTALVNALAALPADLLLVLDDLHLLASPPLRGLLAALVEHAPPRLHLVLASRSDPPLPLPRLRAGGQLLELRAADLALTAPEVEAFLAALTGAPPDHELAAVLAERTEGWAAALQLAALSLRARNDPAALLTSLDSGHRYILDYLADEVIDRQPDDIRRFLLHTCMLERLSGPLCDAVTAERGGQAMLRRLERGNLFLTALDEAGEWYRFHALFAGALRRRLRAAEPELLPTLHARASAWLADAGLLEEAVAHVLAAGDIPRAAALAEEYARLLWNRSQMGRLKGWLRTLPEAVVRERALLRVYLVWALFITGADAEATALLEQVEREAREDITFGEQGATVRGAMTVLRGFLVRMEGDDARAEALAREALAVLPASELSWRSLAAICVGHAAWARGDLDATYEAYSEAEALGARAGDAFIMLTGAMGIANVEGERGELNAAHRRCLRIYQRFTAPGWPPLPALGYVEAGLAGLAYEWNRLDEAEAIAWRLLERDEREHIPDLRFHGHLQLAWVARARGDDEGALEQFDAAGQAYGEFVLARVVLRLHAERAAFELARGNIAAVEAWAASPMGCWSPQDCAASSPLAMREVPLTLARLQLIQGRPDEALALVSPLLAEAQRTGHGIITVAALALTAMALQAQGRRDAALEMAERLVRRVQPEGMLRTLVDAGPLLRDVLAELAERRADALEPPLRAYLAAVLALFAAEPGCATSLSPRGQESGMRTPLSAREREVLALVASGASNAEIAARIVVSVHTVKSHLKHIYEKLDAESRTQALARARELDLI